MDRYAYDKCKTPGAVYSISIAGNVVSCSVTFATLRTLKISPEDFEHTIHKAMEKAIDDCTFDTKRTSSSHWERVNRVVEVAQDAALTNPQEDRHD